ncbi:MAG: DUF192 domain-containing protein [Cyanobacteria bacterium P01_F01_bin.3]
MNAIYGRTRPAAMLLMFLVMTGCAIPEVEPMASSETTSEPEITLSGPGQLLPVSAIAQIKTQTEEYRFELEVARTPEQQALGLMFRSALPDNRGMLFPFGQARRASFWMKDVPVPLDMVFIRNSEVIAIAAEVPPCPTLPCPSYGPDGELVNQVLELRSGRAEEIGLQPGDTVNIEPLTSEGL